MFELAVEHGLVLLENGALIDTAAGEQVPPDACVMPPTTEATVAALRRLTPEEAEQAIARTADIAGPGERLVIGANALLDPVGGFTLSRVELAPGDEVVGRPAAPEVLFMHRGDAEVSVGDEAVELGEGDTMTMPLGLLRRFATQTGAVMFVVRGFEAN